MSNYRANPGGGSWVRGSQDYHYGMAGAGGYPPHHNQQGYGQQGPSEGGGGAGAYMGGGAGGGPGYHHHPAAAAPDSHKRFTGRITKVVDNFGFIDNDVFFQMACVKGKCPREGDSVYCEATFNSRMPFKWTATSVQLQPGDDHRNGGDKRQSPPVRGGPGSGAGGPPGNRRGGSPGRRAVDSQRDLRRSPPPRRHSPNRRRQRSRSPIVRRPSPKRAPLTKRSSPVRERSPLGAKRRQNKLILSHIDIESRSGSASELKRRYPNIYIPSDFYFCRILWQSSFPILNPLNLELSHCNYAICPKEKRLPGAKRPVKEPSDTSYRYQAKVVLLSSPPFSDFYDQCCSPERPEKFLRHPLEMIQLLVGVKDRKLEAIGGPWSPSLDGEDPESPQTLINTAVRTVQYLTGIDLRGCTSWPRISEIRYVREKDGNETVEKVVMFFPDVWRCVPTHQEWTSLSESLRNESAEETPECAQDAAEKPAEERVANIHNEESQESVGEILLPDGSDPKQMKVADLRVELEKRGLNTKGVKQALAERLIEFLQQEKQNLKQEEAAAAAAAAASKTTEEAVVQDAEIKDETESAAEAAKEGADAAAASQAAEEKQKEALPIFDLPTNPAIVVIPNRKVHRGKFDCRIISLSRLLEYSEADNKEFLFELNLFSEFLKSMFYRDHAFNLYKSILEAPDLNKEQENRAAAKKKREEQRKEDKKDEATKAEQDEIEIEIKDEVDEDYEKIYDEKTVRNRPLLLTCVYFDLNHLGYLSTRDVEEIVLSLDFKLSRAQVRTALKRVVNKDGNLEYKKLTNRVLNPEEPPEGFEHPRILTSEQLEKIVRGNAVTDDDAEDNGLTAAASSNAVFVDFDKLKEQVEKSERAKVEVDVALLKTQEELNKTKHQAERLKKDRERLEAEVAKCNKTIENLNEDLSSSRRFSSDIRYTAHNVKNTLRKTLENLEKCFEREKKKKDDKKPEKETKAADDDGDGDKAEEPASRKESAAAPKQESTETSEDAADQDASPEDQPTEPKIEPKIEAEEAAEDVETSEPPSKKIKSAATPGKTNGKTAPKRKK